MSDKQITLTPYLHAKPGAKAGEMIYALFPFDMGGGSSGYACLGQVEVTLPPPDVDPTAAMVETLEREIAATREASERKVGYLLEQISKLQCLEYRPEPSHAG